MDNATIEGTNALMRHERTGVILSTGGAGIVKAAYSSGKPAFGVGPGQRAGAGGHLGRPRRRHRRRSSPASRSTTARSAPASRRSSPKSRCATASSACSRRSKAYLCNDAQKDALGKLLMMPNWTVNPQCVGQAPTKIAKMAGFEVPPETSIICAEIGGVGKQHPLSAEKLSPVLSLLLRAGFQRRAGHLFRAAEVRRRGAHGGDLFEERRAHPRVRHAHAGESGPGEHAGAAGLHRHHHQRVSRR